jgi:hypothetical protein
MHAKRTVAHRHGGLAPVWDLVIVVAAPDAHDARAAPAALHHLVQQRGAQLDGVGPPLLYVVGCRGVGGRANSWNAGMLAQTARLMPSRA